MQTVLAMDFGGTRLKLGVVRTGRDLADHVIRARATEPVQAGLADTRIALSRLVTACGVEPAGVAISFPSIIERAFAYLVAYW